MQIPARGELYRLREMFIPYDGYRFMGFDFSNLELRLTGVYTNEPTIVDAFKNGYDLHSLTAYNVFKSKMDIDYTQSLDKILKEVKNKYGETYRYFAKTLN